MLKASFAVHIYRLFVTRQADATTIDTHAWPYRGYLFSLAAIPMLGLMMDFKQIQQFCGIVGAAFLPLLAVALLIMNSSRTRLGKHRNNWLSQLSLGSTVVFFIGMAWMKWSA